jgi:hypothetical protein
MRCYNGTLIGPEHLAEFTGKAKVAKSVADKTVLL